MSLRQWRVFGAGQRLVGHSGLLMAYLGLLADCPIVYLLSYVCRLPDSLPHD